MTPPDYASESGMTEQPSLFDETYRVRLAGPLDARSAGLAVTLIAVSWLLLIGFLLWMFA